MESLFPTLTTEWERHHACCTRDEAGTDLLY
jgi:hypothetical protein